MGVMWMCGMFVNWQTHIFRCGYAVHANVLWSMSCSGWREQVKLLCNGEAGGLWCVSTGSAWHCAAKLISL